MNEFTEAVPAIEFNFKCQKGRQKELIEFILRFSDLTLEKLGLVVEENEKALNNVIGGKAYLSKRALINLIPLFYMFAGSCEFED